jgi:putative Mg2+ transporter-C (MgtC) family protein
MDPWLTPATESILRLTFASALGAAIGINREMHRQPAGFRTHALVALGAALMTVVAIGLTPANAPADNAAVSRILQGIIAGIGFVGGGAILRRDDVANAAGIHGLTTATSIWVVAAVGIAAGLGLWTPALATVALTLLVLTVGERIDRTLERRLARRQNQSL